MRRTNLYLALSLFAFIVSCSTDPTTKAIDALAGMSKVYVPIEASSLLSLQSALEEKGYGNVKVDDLKRQFVYAEVSFGSALVGYSSESMVPESSLFEPMSVTQWLQFARNDATALGVVLDPGSATPLMLTKSDLGRALAELPSQPDAPMELRR